MACLTTSHLHSSSSISKMSKTRLSPHTAPSRSIIRSQWASRRTSSHLSIRTYSIHRSIITSSNQLVWWRSSRMVFEISTLPLKAQLRLLLWPSWKTSAVRKKSTICIKKMVSSIRKVLTSRSTSLILSAQRVKERAPLSHLRISRVPTVWASYNREIPRGLNRKMTRKLLCGCPPSPQCLKATRVLRLQCQSNITTQTNSVLNRKIKTSSTLGWTADRARKLVWCISKLPGKYLRKALHLCRTRSSLETLYQSEVATSILVFIWMQLPLHQQLSLTMEEVSLLQPRLSPLLTRKWLVINWLGKSTEGR